MIKKYNQFVLESIKSIESICKKYGIQNYTINDDGTVDVRGDVFLAEKNLIELPLNFGVVTGFFECYDNQLITLKGAPKSVGGHFNCGSNDLISLEGSPLEVNNFFVCSHNKLTTLENGPKYVRGTFDCSYNKLTNLVGAPIVVSEFFTAAFNKIINFKGFPEDFEGLSFFRGNPVQKVLIRFPEELRSEAIYWINEYDAIDDSGKVSEMLLEEVFDEIGLEYIPK